MRGDCVIDVVCAWLLGLYAFECIQTVLGSLATGACLYRTHREACVPPIKRARCVPFVRGADERRQACERHDSVSVADVAHKRKENENGDARYIDV